MNIVIIGLGNIGYSLLKCFNSKHKIVILDKDKESFPVKKKNSSNYKYISCDATIKAEVEHHLINNFPESQQIDLLISTVGIPCKISSLENFQQFQKDFNVNVFGNIIPIKYCLNRMIKQNNGTIVGICSTSSHHAPKKLDAYAPSKWALDYLLMRYMQNGLER